MRILLVGDQRPDDQCRLLCCVSTPIYVHMRSLTNLNSRVQQRTSPSGRSQRPSLPFISSKTDSARVVLKSIQHYIHTGMLCRRLHIIAQRKERGSLINVSYIHDFGVLNEELTMP